MPCLPHFSGRTSTPPDHHPPTHPHHPHHSGFTDTEIGSTQARGSAGEEGAEEQSHTSPLRLLLLLFLLYFDFSFEAFGCVCGGRRAPFSFSFLEAGWGPSERLRRRRSPEPRRARRVLSGIVAREEERPGASRSPALEFPASEIRIPATWANAWNSSQCTPSTLTTTLIISKPRYVGGGGGRAASGTSRGWPAPSI